MFQSTLPLCLLLLVLFVSSAVFANNDAEEARWVVSEGNWGTLSYLSEEEQQEPFSEVISYADVDGRIFFYLMGEYKEEEVSLTLSEASFDPTSNYEKAACGPDGQVDAEDPRCAKLVIQGSLNPSCTSSSSSNNNNSNKKSNDSDDGDNKCQKGKEALFNRHPEMKYWPKSHHFAVHDLTPNDLWMLSDFGGGSNIPVKEYESASPKHHPSYFASTSSSSVAVEKPSLDIPPIPPPRWDQKVERARWIVGNSLWTTVSTISVHLKGKAWGNIRSVVDGSSLLNSTGKPVFYLPNPDPTHVDIDENLHISVLFSEAALYSTLNDKGETCGGLDAMDPLCARVVLCGKAIPIVEDSLLQQVYDAFAIRHPLAPWLAHGGAHTGGDYYTIDIERIFILDYFGGSTSIDVDSYLSLKPSTLMQTSTKKNRRGRFSLRNPFAFEECFYNLVMYLFTTVKQILKT